MNGPFMAMQQTTMLPANQSDMNLDVTLYWHEGY